MSATTIWMVEQFGFAMMPFGRLAAAAMLTSGTTSGTWGSMRQALELSITTAPAFAAMGPYSLETDAPAEKSAMSTPAKDSGPSVWTSTCPPGLPAKGSFCPALRALASATSQSTGNFRCSRTRSISRPTAPVAPTTATTFPMKKPLPRPSARCLVCRARKAIGAFVWYP